MTSDVSNDLIHWLGIAVRLRKGLKDCRLVPANGSKNVAQLHVRHESCETHTRAQACMGSWCHLALGGVCADDRLNETSGARGPAVFILWQFAGRPPYNPGHSGAFSTSEFPKARHHFGRLGAAV